MDREAAEKRNLVLAEANCKARQRIRNGTIALMLTLLVAIILGVLAIISGNKVIEAQKELE